MKTYNVRVEKGEDGWLVAQATNLRGAITQGRNLDEIAYMVRDAIQLLTQTKDFNIVLRLASTVRPGPSRKPVSRRRRAAARR
jgi:predicted RNase H-like HicB family nuclease